MMLHIGDRRRGTSRVESAHSLKEVDSQTEEADLDEAELNYLGPKQAPRAFKPIPSGSRAYSEVTRPKSPTKPPRPYTPPNPKVANYGPQPGTVNTYEYGRQSPQPVDKRQKVTEKVHYDFCKHCGMTNHEWQVCQMKHYGHPGCNLTHPTWIGSPAQKAHLECRKYTVLRGLIPQQQPDGEWKMVPTDKGPRGSYH